jgi:hypothetical protein
MKAELLSERRNLVQMCMGLAVGLIGLAALPDSAFAEKMDLGQIPKNVQEGWCKAHNGQYLDWGGAGTTCTTDAGGAMYCDKDNNCTGYPPKTPQKRIRQQGDLVFQGLGTGGKITRRGIESEEPGQPTRDTVAEEDGGIECVQFTKSAACFCSGKPECGIMKAKICNPKAQTCQTKNGVESCLCHVQE